VTVRPARGEPGRSAGRPSARASVRLPRARAGRPSWERGQMAFRIYLIKQLTPIDFTDVVEKKKNPTLSVQMNWAVLEFLTLAI